MQEWRDVTREMDNVSVGRRFEGKRFNSPSQLFLSDTVKWASTPGPISTSCSLWLHLQTLQGRNGARSQQRWRQHIFFIPVWRCQLSPLFLRVQNTSGLISCSGGVHQPVQEINGSSRHEGSVSGINWTHPPFEISEIDTSLIKVWRHVDLQYEPVHGKSERFLKASLIHIDWRWSPFPDLIIKL